jgi:hypothetical protein
MLITPILTCPFSHLHPHILLPNLHIPHPTSLSPSSPLEEATDTNVPEPEDIETKAEVEDKAANTETKAHLQHQHHATGRALDALATIDLKFVLLQECVFVEKMELLAWEDALIKNGVQPCA